MKLILFLIATMAVADPGSEIARARELNIWIHESIEYVVSKDEILEPLDTIRLGGDCADMSSLLVTLLKMEGIEAELVVIDLKNYLPHHAYVKLWGMYFDPVTGVMSSEAYPLLHKVAFSVTLKNILFGERRGRDGN